MEKIMKMKQYISLKIESNSDNKVILLNTIGAFGVKGLALIISLFTMRAYINYFQNQQVLGLWFTLLSILNWILTFDLGIGNGLRNNLVVALVNNEKQLIKKYISSAYMAIGSIVIFIIIASLIIIPQIDWNSVLNISQTIISPKVLLITVRIVFLGILLQFLLKLITSILYAIQKSAIVNLLTLFNSVFMLIYVTISPTMNLEKRLVTLAIAYLVSVNIPLLVTTLWIFSTTLKGSFPNIKFYDFKIAQSLLKIGGIFFLVQIMYMILTTTNEFLISSLTSPDMVVEYQIYNKLFTLVGTFFALGLTPIWSAITKASTESNYVWLRKLFNLLKKITLGVILLQFIMIPFMQILVNIWLGKDSIEINLLYALIFAISGGVYIWSSVVSSFANGFGALKTQVICFSFGVVIKIVFSILLVNILNSWIGVIIANIFSMSLYCFIEPLQVKKFIKSIEMKSLED